MHMHTYIHTHTYIYMYDLYMDLWFLQFLGDLCRGEESKKPDPVMQSNLEKIQAPGPPKKS